MRKRNRENTRRRIPRVSIPEIEQQGNDDSSLISPPPFMLTGIRWGKNRLNLDIPNDEEEDEDEDSEEEEEESSSRTQNPTILQALVPEKDRDGSGRFRFPAEDGTVKWISKDQAWGPDWQNLEFEADEMLSQVVPQYDFLTALAGKLNLDRVEDVFVQSGVERFLGQAEALTKTVGVAAAKIDKFWEQHKMRKELLDLFENNLGGAASLIQMKTHLDDLTIEIHRFALLKSIKDGNNEQENSSTLIQYLIKLILARNIHTPEDVEADLLVITMSEIAKDLLWIKDNRVHRQKKSSNIMEWLTAKKQPQNEVLKLINRNQLLTNFLKKVTMSSEQMATTMNLNADNAYRLGIIIASWAVAVRWGNGPPVKWYMVTNDDIELGNAPLPGEKKDPAVKERNVLWQEQVYTILSILNDGDGDGDVALDDSLNILVSMIQLETETEEIMYEADKTKRIVMMHGNNSKQLMLESLKRVSGFYRDLEAEMGTTNKDMIKPVQTILRFIRRSIDPLEVGMLSTDFINKREENLIVSTISKIEAWIRNLKHQEVEFSDRIDDILDRKIHSVAGHAIKKEIKKEKEKEEEEELPINSRFLIKNLLMMSSGHQIHGAMPPLLNQRRGRHRQSAAIRAAWRLRPAFQARLRLIPSIVAGMGQATEMLRKYYPGLVPRNVDRDTVLKVLTLTPGLLNLFAHLVESLIQKGDVQHARQWNPVRMFDNMMVNNLNAMKSLSSWVWGNPHAIDTGRLGSACGNNRGAGRPAQAAVHMPLQWGQAQDMAADLRRPLNMRNIMPVNQRINQSSSSSSSTTTINRGGQTLTPLSQAIHMTSALVVEPPKKRQKTRSHAVRQRWVEHVTSWDAEDIRNIIMQTAQGALNVKSIF